MSKNRLLELKYFCLCYPELPKSSARRQLIEEVAAKVSPELSRWLLLSVTRGVPYPHLNVPCGKNAFSALKNEFFLQLSRRLDRG